MPTFELPQVIGGHTHFTWGPVVAVHRVGLYAIVEFHDQVFNENGHATGEYEKEKTLFHVYWNGKDANLSTQSLDSALVAAIDYAKNGIGSHAARYACRVLDIDWWK